MDRQPYPAARAVAPRIREHFARHLNGDETSRAMLPDVDVIEAAISGAFWTSLRREEGYVPRISLAFVAPEQATDPLLFARPIPLDPNALAKVAPAVERAGIHLGMSPSGGDLTIWGATMSIPRFSMVIEVAAPGLLVVKHHRGGAVGKFANVAVLEGDQIKVIDEDARSLPDCPPLLTSLLGFESPASWIDSVNLLVQLAVSMRAHHRGGALLVVPPGTETWRESIVQPISYAIVPPFTELARLSAILRERPATPAEEIDLARAVDAVAGLTAVDGATLMTLDYDLLAFGVKIARRRGANPVAHVMVTEPIEGAAATVVDPAALGGTRHLSAAQFVHDQHDAIALVASQDGRFTVFAWSPCENMVHGHRVEALLV